MILGRECNLWSWWDSCCSRLELGQDDPQPRLQDWDLLTTVIARALVRVVGLE